MRLSSPRALFLVGLFALASCANDESTAGGPEGEPQVSLTWLGVTHWLVEYQDTAILLDAYVSRPGPGVTGPTEEGLDLMQRVLDAAGVEALDLILVGHSHFDHAVDCGAVALRTGAQVVGTETTCLIAQAEGLPTDRCTRVGNGNRADPFEGVSIQTIRTIHCNPTGIGTFAELDEEPENPFAAPIGGVVSFLITFGDELTLLYQNSIGPLDGDDSSGEDYVANLEAVLGAGVEIDLWLSPIGFLEGPELDAYYDRVRPRFVLAQHWDGLAPDLEAGTSTSFMATGAVTEATERAGAELFAPEQYFDRFVLSPAALVRSEDAPVRDAFGL